MSLTTIKIEQPFFSSSACDSYYSEDEPNNNENKNKNNNYYYTLLGAPILLYRNTGSFTKQHVTPIHLTLRHNSLPQWLYRYRHLFRQLRTHARWYYPIDQHFFESKGVTNDLEQIAKPMSMTRPARQVRRLIQVLNMYAPHLLEDYDDEEQERLENLDLDHDDNQNNNNDDDDKDIVHSLLSVLRQENSFSNKDKLVMFFSHYVEGNLDVAKNIVARLERYFMVRNDDKKKTKTNNHNKKMKKENNNNNNKKENNNMETRKDKSMVDSQQQPQSYPPNPPTPVDDDKDDNKEEIMGAQAREVKDLDLLQYMQMDVNKGPGGDDVGDGDDSSDDTNDSSNDSESGSSDDSTDSSNDSTNSSDNTNSEANDSEKHTAQQLQQEPKSITPPPSSSSSPPSSKVSSHIRWAGMSHGIRKRAQAQLDTFRDEEYQKQQSFQIQRNARIRMLVETDQRHSAKHCFSLRNSSRRAKVIAQVHQQYELTYIPCKLRKANRLHHHHSLTRGQLTKAKMALQQRLWHADPAYLAAPSLSSIHEAIRVLPVEQRGCSSKTVPSHVLVSQSQLPTDVEDALTQCMGNCIACLACFCSVCTTATTAAKGSSPPSKTATPRSWWVLHPVGPLLDRLRLSHIQLPNAPPLFDTNKWYLNHPSGKRNEYAKELDLGERLWQLLKCGTNKYVARTSVQCIVFEVLQRDYHHQNQPPDRPNTQCLGGHFYLKIIHVVDCRAQGDGRGYVPRYVAAHPNYGGKFTDSKLAIVMASSSSSHNNYMGRGDDGASNVIAHVNVGKSSLRISHYCITNIQDIRQIEFSQQHPMVLWCVARSYIRPQPERDSIADTPMMGHGYALYTVDLRGSSPPSSLSSNNQATFQWSPSAQEHLIEGVHSISGIMVNTNPSRGCSSSLLVSSISAQKTWELDVRLPCRVMTSWHLPHACDGLGTRKSNSGVYGMGFLLTSSSSNGGHPQASADHQSETLFWGVNCTPGSFGLHLYRQPSVQPRFQLDNLECANWPPGILDGNNDNHDDTRISLASSSCFPLPDVGDDVFTCGLDSFAVSTNNLHRTVSKNRYLATMSTTTTTFCVVTATNKGDLYVHNVLETNTNPMQEETAAAAATSSAVHGPPVGTAAFPIPYSTSNKTDARCYDGSLALELCNEFPIPSSCVLKPDDDTKISSNTKTPTKKPPEVVLPFDPSTSAEQIDGSHWNSDGVPPVSVPIQSFGPQLPFTLKRTRKRTNSNDMNDDTETKPLVVPQELVKAARSELLSTMECFQPRPAANSTNMGTKSDITQEVVSTLNDTWDDTKPWIP